MAKNEKRTVMNYGKAKWYILKNRVESKISETVIRNRNMTVNEIDEAIEKITQIVSNAAKKSITASVQKIDSKNSGSEIDTIMMIIILKV